MALIMIFSQSVVLGNSHPGSIHLMMSEELTNGNDAKFEGPENIYVSVEKFLPGTYPVVVRSPGRKGTVLGNGEITVGESGRMVFNLYQMTQFSPTDNKGGLYTVVVGDNKTKNFSLDHVEIEAEYWDVSFAASPGGSLTGTLVFSGIQDGTNWDHAGITVPVPVPAEHFQFDGWDVSFPDAIEQNWIFTAQFSLSPVELTPQDIRAESLLLEGFIPIANPAELRKIRYSYPTGERFGEGTRWEKTYVTPGLSGKYVLVRDIDMSIAGDWSPIGMMTDPFRGTLDGNDYAIKNLVSTGEYPGERGLFGRVEDGVIRYLDLSGPVMGGSGDQFDYVGALAGRILNSQVMNVRILKSRNDMTEAAVTGNHYVGGLVGHSESSTMEHVVNEVTVTGRSLIGGIAGRQEASSSISYSINKGNISGSEGDAGGIAGHTSGEISRAMNYGDVYGRSGIGGIAGSSSNISFFLEEKAIIHQAVNTGDVDGQFSIGGIVGLTEFSIISDTYNMGTIGSSETSNAGGIIGGNAHVTTIKNAYNSARILTDDMSGSDELIPSVSNFIPDVSSSFYNWDQGNNILFSSGTGLDNEHMTYQDSFAGFDFTNLWAIDEGETYPYLKWHSAFYKPMKAELP